MITRPITGQIVRLYASGQSLRQIAATVRVSRSTVRERLLAAAITLRPRGGRNLKKDKPG